MTRGEERNSVPSGSPERAPEVLLRANSKRRVLSERLCVDKTLLLAMTREERRE
jgi:hypothetical protein